MANVVDPNSWRMIPLPDPQRTGPTADPIGSEVQAPESLAASRQSTIDVLTTVLEGSFAAPGDRVVWNLSERLSNLAADGKQLRVDSQHEIAAPAAQFPEQPGVDSEAPAPRPWLVLVENASGVQTVTQAERLRSDRS